MIITIHDAVLEVVTPAASRRTGGPTTFTISGRALTQTIPVLAGRAHDRGHGVLGAALPDTHGSGANHTWAEHEPKRTWEGDNYILDSHTKNTVDTLVSGGLGRDRRCPGRTVRLLLTTDTIDLLTHLAADAETLTLTVDGTSLHVVVVR